MDPPPDMGQGTGDGTGDHGESVECKYHHKVTLGRGTLSSSWDAHRAAQTVLLPGLHSEPGLRFKTSRLTEKTKFYFCGKQQASLSASSRSKNMFHFALISSSTEVESRDVSDEDLMEQNNLYTK